MNGHIAMLLDTIIYSMEQIKAEKEDVQGYLDIAYNALQKIYKEYELAPQEYIKSEK